jgi:rhamnosyltransferase
VVLYHPPPGSKSSVLTLASQVSQIVVVDNTPGDTAWANDPSIRSLQNLRWIGQGENRGIAHALNRGLEAAEEAGDEWMVTFDQDTVIEPGFVDRLLEAALAAPPRERAAMIAPALPGDGGGAGLARVARAITSGALARVDAVRAVGAYREDLFIDYVDFDLCSRLRRAGHHILRHGGVVLRHAIGTPRASEVLGLRVITSNHAPVRRYYKIRNRVVMVREHFAAEPAWMTRQIFSTFWEVAKIAIFEDERAPKLRMMARGLADGLRGRMGSFEQASRRDGPG